MAMFRKEYDELTADQLKILIDAHLNFLTAAAPFTDTKTLIDSIRVDIKGCTDMSALRQSLHSMLKMVLYWDKHKDVKGYFKPVEKSILHQMLRDANVVTSYTAINP